MEEKGYRFWHAMNRPARDEVPARVAVLIWLIFFATLAAAVLWSGWGCDCEGAEARTRNFVASADDIQLARRVAEDAEKHREAHAEKWFGRTYPDWSAPCPIEVKIQKTSGGVTYFNFMGGEVYGWKMVVKGTPDAILADVLPHEVMHTVIHSTFKRMLPRWCDEGPCVTCESEAHREFQITCLNQSRAQGRLYPLRQLFAMYDYPRDGAGVMALYAQGHALTTFLLERGGEAKFVAFIAEGCRQEKLGGRRADAWEQALRSTYSLDCATCEGEFDAWCRGGGLLAAIRRRRGTPAGDADFLANTDLVKPGTPWSDELILATTWPPPFVPSGIGRQPLAATAPPSTWDRILSTIGLGSNTMPVAPGATPPAPCQPPADRTAPDYVPPIRTIDVDIRSLPQPEFEEPCSGGR